MKIKNAVSMMRKVFKDLDKDFTVWEYRAEIECLLNYADGEFIKKLRKEYETQDSRITAYPILVLVQEQTCIGVMADGYGVSCPYGDGETRIEYKHEALEETYKNKQEAIEALKEMVEPVVVKGAIDNLEEINVGYIWHTVECFLTVKAAERYIQGNAHNLYNPRTYVTHISYRNYEMTKLFEEIGLKTKN